MLQDGPFRSAHDAVLLRMKQRIEQLKEEYRMTQPAPHTHHTKGTKHAAQTKHGGSTKTSGGGRGRGGGHTGFKAKK